jgi:molybdate transport system regulatory protein
MKRKLTASIKVDFGNGLRLGAGKILLLKLVAESGSISAAARKMDMSYRKAWLLMNEMKDMFGKAVIETAAGGSGGGGATLTEHGKRMIELYDELQSQADDVVGSLFKSL